MHSKDAGSHAGPTPAKTQRQEASDRTKEASDRAMEASDRAKKACGRTKKASDRAKEASGRAKGRLDTARVPRAIRISFAGRSGPELSAKGDRRGSKRD